jgi:preprotein translocase subunit YajC
VSVALIVSMVALVLLGVFAVLRATRRRARPAQLTAQELQNAFASLQPGDQVLVSGVVVRRANRALWEVRLEGGTRWASGPDQAVELLRSER